ncbi:putative ACT domain-containing protein ACR1-12 [Helianthus annuus]|nr:putative ACT domain-containing protein ACR1-12 [Helianthus annuus]KAJ0803647.1 putative ACT domain-containing protein ACR1-12 [Helianthus annuus]KAJ0888495.1 putative ACT domain-containing protein ACR1-12 [Helianthus annuus]
MIMSWLQDLGSGTRFNNSTVSVGLPHSAHLSTVIELIGSDRPGLLSEGYRALSHLRCNIVNANVWSHNTRAAFLIVLTDEESGTTITDPTRLCNIKTRLCNVLTVTSNDDTRANIVVTQRVIHPERRLHQMMLANRDYQRGNCVDLDISRRPDVNAVNVYCKDCLVVTIRCTDRPRLLFDIIYTLIDMDYIVLHGYIKAERTETFQVC